MAREALAGKWGLGVGVAFIYWLIYIFTSFIPVLGGIIQFVIIGPLTFGLKSVYLNISRQEDVEVGGLFSGFSHFGIAWLVNFVVNLLAGLAGLAAAIPGIILIFTVSSQSTGGSGLAEIGVIVALIPGLIVYYYMLLRYALAMFIAIDDPEVGTMQALNLSVARMRGRKVKLFMLHLSFVGWFILGTLSFLIGLLFVLPYLFTSIAAFYDDIGDEGEVEEAAL